MRGSERKHKPRPACNRSSSAAHVWSPPSPFSAQTVKAKLDEDDDAMDALHRELFSVLLEHQWPLPVATVVDLTLLGWYYERFADHAVEI